MHPFFIVGVHRSGTTLLRFMLSSHSRIYIPPESDFIPFFFRKQPLCQLSIVEVAKYLEIIFSQYRFVEDWQGATPKVNEFFELMETSTPAGFLNQLYGQYAAQNGASRWGDKTPIYASYVDTLSTIFPKAQFIHILRDPFDCVISLMDKYADQEFHIDIYYAARNWERRIRNIRVAAEKMPLKQYTEVLYEKLVENPEYELQRICEFLGEDYEISMVQHHKLAQKVIDPNSHFFDNVRQPVNNKSLGRGRSGLSIADRRLIQNVVGSLMKELNYATDDLGDMTYREKIRLTSLKAKFTILQTGRKAATSLGLLPPI